MVNWEWGAKYLQASMAQSLWLLAILGTLFVVARVASSVYASSPSAESRFAAAQSFTREFALVMALRATWQYVGQLAHTHSDAAEHRAAQIQALQQWLHLPDELTIQHIVLPHGWLVWALNAYYATMHLDGMLVFLIWVWWKHRDAFRTVRNTVAATTLICLLIQIIPVAPPRLLPGAGFVDTALQYGQSVYGPYQSGLAAQLTAMPSLHIGWSFIIAWYVIRLGRGPLRYIGVADVLVTFLVIVATANHWWLDGFAAIGVVLLVLGAQAGLRDAWAAWRGRRAEPAVPALIPVAAAEQA